MNATKNTMLTMLFMIVSMVGALAQGQRGDSATPEERAARMTERMKTSLNLTEDQAAKVHALNLQMVKDIATARESGQDLRSGMQNIMAKYNADLQKILTPEQLKKYQDNRRQQRQNRFNGSGSGNTSN